MDNQADLDDLNSYLELQNKRAKRNTEIVASSDLKQPFMLHIDEKPPTRFIPMLSRRSNLKEDNTMPRVTVADTLLGCMIGYAAVENDFFNSAMSGYVISAIDFTLALKPNKLLVFDTEQSNEHWLVGYNSQNLSFKPREVGKLFVTELSYSKEVVNAQYLSKSSRTELYVDTRVKLALSDQVTLEPGYHRLTILKKDFHNDLTYRDGDSVIVEKLKESDYMSRKRSVAVHLSADNKAGVKKRKPVYANW